MKIQFLDGKALAYLHKALRENSNREERRHYKQICDLFTKDTNADLLQFLQEKGFDTPLKDTRFDCSPLTLDPNPVGSGELVNVQNIMDCLANISPAVASNEKFWAGLCIGHAWTYVRKRWKIDENPTGPVIQQHFLFGFGPRRSLTRNALARLWLIGYLTVDNANLTDPFDVTRFMLDKLDQGVQILERNSSDNPRIIREIVRGIRAATAEGFVVDRDPIRELAKYVNIVGGVSVLDLLPADAIYEKVLARAKKICKKVEA